MKPRTGLLFLFLTASLAYAQTTPDLMSYQGRVTDGGGNLIGHSTPANRLVTFQLYTATTGGTPIYAETQTVTISEGEFSVLIGNGTGITKLPGAKLPSDPIISLGAAINAAAGSVYLGVTVDDGTAAADVEISPRQQLVAGAYAFRAQVAETVKSLSVTAAMIDKNTITADQIAPSTIDYTRIASKTIQNDNIANNTISAGKLDTTSIGVWLPSGTTNVYRDNFVGIGNKSPGYPLSFGDGDGEKISLVGSPGTPTGIAVTSNTIQVHGKDSTSAVAFGWGPAATMTTTMLVKGDGHVGIGTTTPTERLVVAGTTVTDKLYSNGIVRAAGGGYNSATVNTGFSFASPGDTDGGLFSGGDGTLQFFTNGSEKVRVDGSGYMGIGTTSAAARLHVAGGINVAAYESTHSQGLNLEWNKTGGGGESWILNQKGGGAGGIIFGEVTSANATTERMRIASTGYVGIANGNPLAPLHVSGSSITAYYQEAYMNTEGAGDSKNTYVNTVSHSIIADANVRSAGFQVVSDSRIKTDKHLSDSGKDLETLLGIQITDYRFVDPIQQGGVRQKKVIAQQVEEIYPQAVTKSTGVVPDIYKRAGTKEGWTTLETDLQVGDRVKLIGEGAQNVHEVLEVRDGAFRTDYKGAAGDIFVYGREVKDFRSVDYDALSMLNVSATQELKKEKDAEVKALERKVADLEARLSRFEKLMSAQ